MDAADHLADFRIGCGGHRASVQHGQIAGRKARRLHKARRAQMFLQRGALRLVRPAAEIVELKPHHSNIIAYPDAYPSKRGFDLLSGTVKDSRGVNSGTGSSSGQPGAVIQEAAPRRAPAQSSRHAHGTAPVRLGFHDAESRNCPSDPPLLKALPAVHWPALRWPEGNRGFFATLRAHRRGFSAPMALATQHLIPLSLARLTSLGVVLETLVCVKELFARGEYEL